MQDINRLIRINIELEGLLRVLAVRDSAEARAAITDKLELYRRLVGEYLSDEEVAAAETAPETPAQYVEIKDEEAEEPETDPEAELAEHAVAAEAEKADTVEEPEPEAEEPETDGLDAPEVDSRVAAGSRDLLAGMTVNDKYQYIREVFDGDEDNFRQTMAVMGELPDYDTAYDYLVNDLMLDPDNVAVAQLLEYLNREM